jgi:hypothetical protein
VPIEEVAPQFPIRQAKTWILANLWLRHLLKMLDLLRLGEVELVTGFFRPASRG